MLVFTCRFVFFFCFRTSKKKKCKILKRHVNSAVMCENHHRGCEKGEKLKKTGKIMKTNGLSRLPPSPSRDISDRERARHSLPPHTTRLEAYIYGHDATANMWWWRRRWKKRLVCVVIEKRGMPQNTGSGRLVNIYTSKYCATV